MTTKGVETWIVTGVTTGQLLRAWREKARLTQEELASAAGYESRSYVGDYERDRASPSIRTLLVFISAIERSYQSLGENENVRLARFFLGPASVEGELLVVRESFRPGRQPRQPK